MYIHKSDLMAYVNQQRSNICVLTMYCMLVPRIDCNKSANISNPDREPRYAIFSRVIVHLDHSSLFHIYETGLNRVIHSGIDLNPNPFDWMVLFVMLLQ